MIYTDEQLNEMKIEFITLLRSTNKPGIENLINWLCDENRSDFFTAPSSKVYHSCFKGGLLVHSLNVYKAAKRLIDNMSDLVIPEKNIQQRIPQESLIICCLLHDICKANFYKPSPKWFKDQSLPYQQQWQQFLGYEIDDQVPLGHGEKSVIITQCFIPLTIDEMMGIRWHMGMTDPGLYLSDYTRNAMMKAINDYPMVMVLMQADSFASFMMEKEIDQKTECRITSD